MSVEEYGEPPTWDDYWNLSFVQGLKPNKVINVFEKYITKNMKVTKVEGIKNYAVFVFPDGSAVGIAYGNPRHLAFFPKNYEKCINKPSTQKILCCFGFLFFDKNKGKGWGHSWDQAQGYVQEPNIYNWDGTEKGLYIPWEGCNGDPKYFGTGLCTMSIKFNNWKIPKKKNFPKISY